MHRLLLPCLLLCCNLNLSAQTDATVEPPTMLEVTVDGQVKKIERRQCLRRERHQRDRPGERREDLGHR
ncbi:MAG: hypothetical protein IPP26_09585 [Flavobacteriales bacterium]|nr:hypothetical protein [Flavobacteriales bacterium]